MYPCAIILINRSGYLGKRLGYCVDLLLYNSAAPWSSVPCPVPPPSDPFPDYARQHSPPPVAAGPCSVPLLFFGCVMFVCIHVSFILLDWKNFETQKLCHIWLYITQIDFHYTQVSSWTEWKITKTSKKFDFGRLFGTWCGELEMCKKWKHYIIF